MNRRLIEFPVQACSKSASARGFTPPPYGHFTFNPAMIGGAFAVSGLYGFLKSDSADGFADRLTDSAPLKSASVCGFAAALRFPQIVRVVADRLQRLVEFRLKDRIYHTEDGKGGAVSGWKPEISVFIDGELWNFPL